MPVIQAELNDFKGSNHFACLDFCSNYWQCPLDPQSFDACGIIAPQGAFVSTRALRDLNNALPYFQSTKLSLFVDIKDAVKAWIEDFTIQAKTEPQLLEYLETFSRYATHTIYICQQKRPNYTQER